MSLDSSKIDKAGILPHAKTEQRSVTMAFLGMTIVVTLVVSLFAGMFQVYTDFSKEMHNVERGAEKKLNGFLSLVERHVWEFNEEAIQKLVDGLFTHPGIRYVEVKAGGSMFLLEESRELTPTFSFFEPQIVTFTKNLYQPVADGEDATYRQLMGFIKIEVDRTMMSPNTLDRILMFFTISLVKNVVICALLFLFLFVGLARYTLMISRSLADWEPKSGVIKLPRPPKFLRNTELDVLGQDVERLMQIASREFTSLKSSNDKISDLNAALVSKSEGLSVALKAQNSELEKANKKLFELATRDTLTNCFNRRYFDDETSRIWRECPQKRENFAILICDIDYFKVFNDYYGHPEGDACLRDVARVMQQCCDEFDSIFARYGGEEFIVFVHDSRQAEELAEYLVSSIAGIEREHAKSPVAPHVTVSIGFAENKFVEAHSILELTEAADLALYRAKESGRNGCCAVSPELLDVVTLKSNLDFEIEHAINIGAFEPYFQPQINMLTGEIVGMEVLARMPTSNGGVSLPKEFLGEAEQLGVANRIDTLIQRQALDILSKWSNMGIAPKCMSFNLSESTLLTGQIPGLLSEMKDLVASRVSFEIAEKVVLEKKSSIFDTRLRDIVDLGASIEIDEFGSGMSSICALADLAPNRIKISKDLIAMVGIQPEGKNVVKAVVEMANAFNIDLIAEGVENEYQSRFLLELGVNIQQGYLIAYPLPPAKMEALLAHSSKQSNDALQKRA